MSRYLFAACGVALAAPIVGLAVLLGCPSIDRRWEHHPSHFWIVMGAAVMAAALGGR